MRICIRSSFEPHHVSSLLKSRGAGSRYNVFEIPHQFPAIGVISTDGQLRVSTRHAMIDCTGKLNATRAGHEDFTAQKQKTRAVPPVTMTGLAESHPR